MKMEIRLSYNELQEIIHDHMFNYLNTKIVSVNDLHLSINEKSFNDLIIEYEMPI